MDLNILKTWERNLATLTIGQFQAVETQKICHDCGTIYRSEQLRSLTPHQGYYGFDVIEYVGKALFVHCCNEQDIQADLAVKNIPISLNEITFLGKRFIVYLALTHKQCEQELKGYMDSKGGYILHMDGTCEDDSPHIFSCIDEISNIVLGNSKIPAEDSQYIIPLLRTLKSAYGDPAALVHDMGSAILKAVAIVFPGIPDYICHFHFLRDLGKDLFDFEYRTIRRYMRSHRVGKMLNQTVKKLKSTIDENRKLTDILDNYLESGNMGNPEENLDKHVTAYLIVVWVLEYNSVSHGFGFPFDRPHLEYYLRLKTAYPVLKQLKSSGVTQLPIEGLSRALRDSALQKLVSRMQEKISVFDELRSAMRIAEPNSSLGLNDQGDDDIKTIESRVKKFRHSEKIESYAKDDVNYQKMVQQIDKYWEKLFADPIEVDTPRGKITLQPQRTNNLMEQSFRMMKRRGRKKSGQCSLNKRLKGMLADTPLIRNLEKPEYIKILLKGKRNLAERFAEIDIELVREEEKKNTQRWKKYPKRMAKLFKIPQLPQKLRKMASK